MTPISRWLKPGRAALANFVLPVALAWVAVSAIHDRVYRPNPQSPAAKVAAYGPIRLKIRLPGTTGGIPEPLIVCGRPGAAALVYIRLLKHAQASVGVEFWGLGRFESDAFALPAADAQIELICFLPAFFPPAGDRQWQSTPREEQSLRAHQYALEVDGVMRLKGAVDYKLPPHSPLALGVNSVGGSYVSAAFTGKILEMSEANPFATHDGGRHD